MSTKMLPLVIGSLGVVANNLEHNLRNLDIPRVVSYYYLFPFLDTVTILRKVLSA